jgi:hypothetical protein
MAISDASGGSLKGKMIRVCLPTCAKIVLRAEPGEVKRVQGDEQGS